jgi:phosphate-selective porin
MKMNRVKFTLSRGMILLLSGLCCFSGNYAQELKVSGYIQSQFQWGEKDATLKVGAPNENPEEAFNRVGIRRGRIKFVYEKSLASGVFQLDVTEKGTGIKDAYLQIKDPWVNTLALKAGVFDRPFGNEISYSSSRRESPERSTVFQTLFPDERDLGVMLVLQPAKTSPWNFLKLEAGLFAGNGIKQETDSRRDFIGHLSAAKSIGSNLQIGGGVSYYNGSVYPGAGNVFYQREYIGLDARFSLLSAAGMSQVRAEYLSGKQPGSASSSKSPNASTLPATGTDMYIRHFQGGYVIYIQDFGITPLSSVLKYDWYNPNTRVKGNSIGLNGTGTGDIASQTFGFGLLWRASNSVRMMAYYEINRNERTENIDRYRNDRQDNVFTLRLQYKF